MQKLLNKVAPLGVMAVCMIWCCWSQLRESTPLLAATEAKLPRIERKLLHPELSPASERDPFLQHKPEPLPEIQAIEVSSEIAEKPPFDPQTVLPSIRLDATILGAKPLAVINGKMHSEGEIIVLDAAPEIHCRLQRVHSDGIVMTIETHSLLIGYSNASRAHADPVPGADAVRSTRNETEFELSEGTPTIDELESAVADALDHQPQATDSEVELDSNESDDRSTDPALEACEFEQDLLNKFDELRNNHEE